MMTSTIGSVLMAFGDKDIEFYSSLVRIKNVSLK